MRVIVKQGCVGVYVVGESRLNLTVVILSFL